jgi:hypothetical protein
MRAAPLNVTHLNLLAHRIVGSRLHASYGQLLTV